MTETNESPDAQTVAALDAIFAPLNRSDAPGLVVGVALHGRPLYRRGFGMASLEHGVANTPATRMNLGSTAKHMTALAALLLVEDGKLDIDAPVNQYLPELAPLEPAPSLRQYMNHTSGHRCYLDLSFIGNGLAVKPAGYALAAQARQTGWNFPPGERMLYCNGGYHLLATVVARISGMSFERFLTERLFEPLGMRDTEAAANDFEIRLGAATQHVAQPGGGWRRGLFPAEEGRGDGGVLTTVDDMLRWLVHLRGPARTVGSESSWTQMLAHTRLTNGSVSQYGLGLVRSDYRGVEVVHHSGGVIGGSCQMITVPAHELDVIIITNGAPVDPSALANQVIDAVLGDGVLKPPRSVTHAKAADYPALLGRSYHSAQSGFLIGFGDSGGKLGFSVCGNYLMPLRREGDKLELGYEDAGVGPFTVRLEGLDFGEQAPAALAVAECGHFETFALLPSEGPDVREAGSPLVGQYDVPDMDAKAEVSFTEEGVLHMRLADGFGVSTMVLKPLTLDVFSWKIDPPMLPIPGVLNVHRKDGRVTGFDVSVARTRNVRFVRRGE